MPSKITAPCLGVIIYVPAARSTQSYLSLNVGAAGVPRCALVCVGAYPTLLPPPPRSLSELLSHYRVEIKILNIANAEIQQLENMKTQRE